MSAEHGQQQPSGGRRGRSSGDKKSKKRSRRKETYSMYIYKVLKQVRVGSSHARVCVQSTTGQSRTPFPPGTEGRGLRHTVPLVKWPHSISEVPTASQYLSCTCDVPETLKARRHNPEAYGALDGPNASAERQEGRK